MLHPASAHFFNVPYLLCVHVGACITSTHMEVRRQLGRVTTCLHVGPGYQIQATGLGGKCRCPLGHLAGSFLLLSETGFRYVVQVGLKLVTILSQP